MIRDQLYEIPFRGKKLLEQAAAERLVVVGAGWRARLLESARVVRGWVETLFSSACQTFFLLIQRSQGKVFWTQATVCRRAFPSRCVLKHPGTCALKVSFPDTLAAISRSCLCSRELASNGLLATLS